MIEVRKFAYAALAIIASATVMAIILFHPSHAEAQPIFWRFTLAEIVHVSAIGAGPLLATGVYGLARTLGGEKVASQAGLAFWAMGCIALVLAAMVSGLISGDFILAAHSAEGEQRAALGAAAKLAVKLNRSFAHIHVAMFSIAILLFSTSWRIEGFSGGLLRTAGVGIAAAILVWQFIAGLELNPSNMVVVFGAQCGWIIAASLLLLISPPGADDVRSRSQS